MEDNKCGFCHTGPENESVCGTLHSDKVDGKVICAHHKCMQYSALLVQYKTDSFGGFKKQEVAKEIKRGSRLICALCKNDKTKKNKKGATSGCAWASCRKTFHYLCVSMNSRTVAKRYRVAAGEKVVILYRVFCCQDHEKRYRENLSAEDIVGQNQSSDEEKGKKEGGDDDDDDDKTDDYDANNSESEKEPPKKKTKTTHDKTGKTEESESGMSSPGMTNEEILNETRRQFSLLQQRNNNSVRHENGEDSFLTAGSDHDSGEEVTEDFNTSNSPGESDFADNHPGIRSIDDGFHIIIPSKLDGTDFKNICEQAGFSEESCLLWPKGYNKKGLQDKHMPFLMWNLADKLSQQDTDGFIKCLNHVSPDQYECVCNLHEQMKSSETMEWRLINLANKLNTKYKTEVCRVLKMSVNDANFFSMLLSLPKVMLEQWDVWSLVNVYVWSRETVVPMHSSKQLNPSLEKKILLKWLMPRLRNKSCEITAYPLDETIRLDHQGHHKFLSVAREIEFRLETLSQNLRSKSLVKVLILRKVNRENVNFKPYLQTLLEQFFSKNAGYECYCVVHVLPTDGLRDTEDVLPQTRRALIGRRVNVFSAFNPRYGPVSCLVAYTASSDITIRGLGDSVEDRETPPLEDSEQLSLYLDVDETPVET